MTPLSLLTFRGLPPRPTTTYLTYLYFLFNNHLTRRTTHSTKTKICFLVVEYYQHHDRVTTDNENKEKQMKRRSSTTKQRTVKFIFRNSCKFTVQTSELCDEWRYCVTLTVQSFRRFMNESLKKELCFAQWLCFLQIFLRFYHSWSHHRIMYILR